MGKELADYLISIEEYLKLYKISDMQKAIKKNNKYITVDFLELQKYNMDLSDYLINEPDECLKAFEITLKERFSIEGDFKDFQFSFYNLPDNRKIPIDKLRAEDIGKFIKVEGQVGSLTEVYGLIISSKFECRNCGNIINVLQISQQYKTPSGCGCDGKSKFRLVKDEIVNAYDIILEEVQENTDKSPLPQIRVLFKIPYMTEPQVHHRLISGRRVRLSAIVKSLPDPKDKKKVEWYLECNHVEIFDDDYTNIEITSDDIKNFEEFASEGNCLKRLSHTIFKGIVGYEIPKEFVILMTVGGIKEVDGNAIKRGNMHGMLVGDPATAKTQIMKKLSNYIPKSRYISGGSGVTSVGLTAGVEDNKLLGKHVLKAGAFAQANNGMVFVDEMDGITGDVSKSLNEALEDQVINVNKIVTGKLPAECSALFCANPINKRLDPHKTVREQIAMPDDLISRVDAIFVFRDESDEQHDTEVLNGMFGIKQKEEKYLSRDFILKYLIYAKNMKPRVQLDVDIWLRDEIVKLRKFAKDRGDSGMPISFRDGASIRRIAQAVAKIELRNTVDLEHVKKAFEIKMFSLNEVAFDKETGRLNVDVLLNKDHSKKNLMDKILSYITENDDLNGKGNHDIEVMICEIRKINSNILESDIEQAIVKLKQSGEIFEPRNGFVRMA